MSRKSLEEIKAAADEYAEVAKQIARVETARDKVLGPIVQRHAEEMVDAVGSHDKRIEKLQRRADELKKQVLDFVAEKKRTYRGESELAEFGVEVGEKQLERQPDKKKLWDVCKKKGVEFFDLVTVMLAEADKRLGTKEVNAISERRTKATRDEYLRLKS